MLYVGYHKGSQNDGYICSSKWMLEEYKQRPENFTRMILAEGTAEDCHALEVTILKTADAMHSDRFYNQNNGEVAYVRKHNTVDHNKKISKGRAKFWADNYEPMKKEFLVNVINPVATQKARNTVQIKYGVTNVSQCKIIKNKKEQTSLLKFGKPYHTCVDESIKQQALQLRIKEHLSCKEIANQLNLNQSSVSRWIREANLPPLTIRKDGRKYVWHANKRST